jgi:hypothetical protein
MTHKIPGWGLLRPLDTRTGPKGRQFLVCPPGHEACIWAGLQEVAHHQGRIIYHPTT